LIVTNLPVCTEIAECQGKLGLFMITAEIVASVSRDAVVLAASKTRRRSSNTSGAFPATMNDKYNISNCSNLFVAV
jgi:hypothetical protein